MAIAHDVLPDGDGSFVEFVRSTHPEWLEDPEVIFGAYYLRAAARGAGGISGQEIWRVARVLLDLFADFAASQVGLFVKDAKMQVVLESVLRNFGGQNVGDSDFTPSEVLRLAFSSTVNGVLDAREALELDQEWLCEGMAESILDKLARIDGLTVADKTDSFQLGSPPADFTVIGHLLNVDHLLHGNIRRQGKRLQIHVQLVRAADAHPVWTQEYDREIADIFAIQDDIYGNVASELQLQLIAATTTEWPGR